MTFLKSEKMVYENIANSLMIASSEKEYENKLNELEDFITENVEEREFLYDWISWWDCRREHFSRAYKNPSAPSMNLAECYNSKYVRCNEINLKLIDSAKLDTAAALQTTEKRKNQMMKIMRLPKEKNASEHQEVGSLTDIVSNVLF